MNPARRRDSVSILKATFVPVEPRVDEKRVTEKIRDPDRQVLVGDENAVQEDVDRVRQGNEQGQKCRSTKAQQAACNELDQPNPEDDVTRVFQRLHKVAEW